MLGLIIAIALIIFGVVAYNGILSDGFSGFIIILGVIAILVCLFAPINGYEEPELVSEIELNSFYEQNGKDIYAIKLDYNQVAITYTEKEYIYGNEQEIMHTEAIYAKIVEAKDCKVPVKQTYIKKSKKGIWCVGAGIKVEETIIVAPEGSVRK